MHAGDVVERLGNPYPAWQHGHVGDEADIAHEQIALRPGIASEHAQFSLVRREPEDGIQCGGFAGTIGTDDPENAALFDPQIDAVEGDGCAESLAQAAGFYACHGFSAPPRRDWAWLFSAIRRIGDLRRSEVPLPSGPAAEWLPRLGAILRLEISGVHPAATECARPH